MTSICFVSGTERDARFPRFVEKAGLTNRLAVIQDTQVEGFDGMYFDESLWRRLVAFMCEYNAQAELYVAASVDKVGRKEQALSVYMSSWESTPVEDRSPPGFMGLRHGNRLLLCMIREYWNRIGGPYPYSDSYTYSILSDRDLTDDIRTFLRKAPQADHWNLAVDVIQAENLRVTLSLLAKVQLWLGLR